MLHVPDYRPDLTVDPVRHSLDDRLFLGAQHDGWDFLSKVAVAVSEGSTPCAPTVITAG
jgi:hypothetical protein